MSNRRFAEHSVLDEQGVKRIYEGNLLDPVDATQVDEMASADFSGDGYDIIALDENDLWEF